MSLENSARDQRILALREEGRTLQQIAVAVGLTRERVRQILRRAGGPTAVDVRTAARARRAAEADELSCRIRDDIRAHPGSTHDEIASRLDVARADVFAHLPDDVRALVVYAAATMHRTWSDEQVFAALHAAATYAYPLTTKAYNELLRIGEIRGPSVPRVTQRFGTWAAACREAGVEPGRARRDYQSKWTDEDLLSFVRQYLAEPNCPGTFTGYDQWRRAMGVDAPSSPLLRQRLGPWSTVKRRAFQP